VDDCGPRAGAHDDEHGLALARIRLAVYGAGRDVEEVAGARLRYDPTPRAGFHSYAAGHDVDRSLARGMVMPGRARARRGPHDTRPQAPGRDRLLARHSHG